MSREGVLKVGRRWAEGGPKVSRRWAEGEPKVDQERTKSGRRAEKGGGGGGGMKETMPSNRVTISARSARSLLQASV